MLPDSTANAQSEVDLKRRAFAAVAGLERSLAEARQADASLRPGAHGRRRRGVGEEFWQFRPAQEGDPARLIDWRRSARSDDHFVRDKEMQTSNAVMFWADNSRSMQFSGDQGRRTKADRARLIALALAILFAQNEERVGVVGSPEQPRPGLRQIDRMAFELFGREDTEYGVPGRVELPRAARLVLLSDFLAPMDDLTASLNGLADREVGGVLVQILDPFEMSFPFDGRTLFRSMGGRLEFESLQARRLKDDYSSRLKERIEAVAALAGNFGWSSRLHVTDGDVRGTLHWLCASLGSEGGILCS